MESVFVAYGADQPSGSPISASTKDGLSATVGDPLFPSCCVVLVGGECVVWSAVSPSGFRLPCVGMTVGRFESVAAGVPHIAADFVSDWCVAPAPGEPFDSRAHGVGQVSDACTARPFTHLPACDCAGRFESVAAGDAHAWAAWTRLVWADGEIWPRLWESVAVAVGQEPEPVSLVGGANGCCL